MEVIPVNKKEENQKKIAYLKKYKYAILDEKMILEEIRKLRADKMFPSLAMDGMPHGNGTSDLSEYAARLDEEINKLKVQRLEKVKIYSDISSRIRRVEDDNQRELLMYRYIKGMSWEDIAVKLNYTWRHVHRIHSQALDSIDIKDVIVCHSKSVI